MNQKEIKDIIKIFNNSDLFRMKIKEGDFILELERGGASMPVAGVPAAVAAPVIETPAPAAQPVSTEPVSSAAGEYISSPMVGTFYRSPSPDSPVFVEVGSRVAKGQTLCILEAMKIMNELEAEYDCKILDILVEDGQPVEYDMPLFLIEKV